ncbi:hypothetical protein M3Y94_00866200 [Aphelenchoides besseyi]|nr:hypothetical protein M3Y94_00866200 [Aphelenchoides besseyi]
MDLSTRWTRVLCSCLLIILSSEAQTLKASDDFHSLFQKQVSVSIDPLEVVYDQPNQTEHNADCNLSIHRENCLNPRIESTDKIFWNNRICFKWTCTNTSTHVMRVVNCWTGSQHMPLYLIDKNGCTLERNMIGSPKYENSLLAAYSLGWLSVRLVGTDQIRLSCTIRLCHVCDENCPHLTPPRHCIDSGGLSSFLFTRWNQTNEWEQQCKPEEFRRRKEQNLAMKTSINLFIIGVLLCTLFINERYL